MLGTARASIARAVCVWMIAFLRDAAWLTPERAGAYRRVMLAMMVVTGLGWVGLSHHGLDLTGKPLGTDFVSFWTAARMAIAGQSAAVYEPALHAAAEHAAFPDVASYFAFFYPPVFLLMCLPLAALPYLGALVVWLGVTGLAYWRSLRAIWPQGGTALVTFPAVFIDIGHGQNGLLTAALFATAMKLMDRRPVLAGMALGCLIYKPQFLLAVPLVLLVARRWWALLGLALSSMALAAISAAVFGVGTWRAFLATTALAREALEQGLMGFEKLQSVFGAVRLLGGGVGLAYALQAVMATGVLICLIRLAMRRPPGDALVAALAVAAPLITPFVLDYDLLVLAAPLAWIMRGALRSGFAPWEKSVLAAGFALPLVSRTLAGFALLPLGPVVLLATFAVVVARVAQRPYLNASLSD
jgi:alpha-1,2-mannosyltransferase